MQNRLSPLYARVKYIVKHQGLIALFRLGFTLWAEHLFHYGTYYLYEHTIEDREESNFAPKIKDFTFQIVSSIEYADKLAREGYDIYLTSINARQRLAKGAIAFCILVGADIAHIGWLAMNEEAKEIIEPFPYFVDFQNREAWTGGTLTLPKYEGNGLMTYGYYKRFQFLHEKGILKSRNAVGVKNIASQRVHSRFHPRKYARALHVKILWWELWKETPLKPD
jgi:hypothetical protein